MDDLLADFLTEVNEGLPELDNAVVEFERQSGDKQTLSLIFRHVHTIKGTCGFLGLPRLERVAHAAEEILGRLRDGKIEASRVVVDHILAALDRIRMIVDELASTEREPVGDDLPLIAALALISECPPRATAAIEDSVAEIKAQSTAPQFAGQTIRVGVQTLESLMVLVGELGLTRNQLVQLSPTQADSRFATALQRLSRLTSDLQDNVMKTRMQPIGHAWNKLPRLVRDLQHDLGKRIELDMQGAETELDRQVLEQIRDPLTHIVRNAADHGLETSDVRIEAGKRPVGRIALNAFHERGHVIIEVSDDGRGLDVARIKAKAIAQNLATAQEVAAMSEAQVQHLVFMPGFSTAAAVTSVSGRGVGMDVVKTNVERISGSVELRSAPGRGTTLTIRIPLTLAINAG